MSQTRLGSFIESLVNVLVGAGVALVSQLLIFPWFNIHISLADNLWITAWFTLISVARSYILRRWFNARIVAAIEKLEAK